MELVDTHAHLEDFNNIAVIVERAKAVSVIAIVAVAADLRTCQRVLQLSKEHRDFIHPALGIHPQETSKDIEAALSFIRGHLDECVALGEIGLDYWMKINQEAQRNVFTKLLRMATQKDMPVCVHSRGSWEDCYRLLRENLVRRAVFHWYSGSLKTLMSIVDSGYLISATPASEYSKAHREAIRNTPFENLMLETDCPVKYHGIESEPADVAKTLAYVSTLRGVSERTVALKTTENAIRFFRLTH